MGIDAQPWLIMFFVPLIFIVSIALMQLVTAVLVESVLTSKQRDRDMEVAIIRQKAKRLGPLLQELFEGIDSDNSGTITVEEILAVRQELPEGLKDILKVDNLMELFEILDI